MSQLQKAIFIDENNKDGLITWYADNIFDGLIINSVGYYLVAGFGEMSYQILDKATLDANYTITGKQLQNGYFEVSKK